MIKNTFEKRDEDGQLHCEDGPALCTTNLMKWYHHGKLHREDGPAIIVKRRLKSYYQNGDPYRLNGPCTIHYNEESGREINKSWYFECDHPHFQGVECNMVLLADRYVIQFVRQSYVYVHESEDVL